METFGLDPHSILCFMSIHLGEGLTIVQSNCSTKLFNPQIIYAEEKYHKVTKPRELWSMFEL